MKLNLTLIAGAAAAVVIVLKFKDLKGIGAGVGGAAVDVVDGLISGAVIGIGQGVGVPPTNLTACQRQNLFFSRTHNLKNLLLGTRMTHPMCALLQWPVGKLSGWWVAHPRLDQCRSRPR